MNSQTGIIEASPGVKSSTRVMALLLVVTGCAVYGWCAHKGIPVPDVPSSWMPLVAGALGAPSANTMAEAWSAARKALAK